MASLGYFTHFAMVADWVLVPSTKTCIKMLNLPKCQVLFFPAWFWETKNRVSSVNLKRFVY